MVMPTISRELRSRWYKFINNFREKSNMFESVTGLTNIKVNLHYVFLFIIKSKNINKKFIQLSTVPT